MGIVYQSIQHGIGYRDILSVNTPKKHSRAFIAPFAPLMPHSMKLSLDPLNLVGLSGLCRVQHTYLNA